MKKIILISLVFIGCTSKNVTEQRNTCTINGRKMSTYIIEGCEYIGFIGGSDGDFLTHKGNCKGCKP